MFFLTKAVFSLQFCFTVVNCGTLYKEKSIVNTVENEVGSDLSRCHNKTNNVNCASLKGLNETFIQVYHKATCQPTIRGIPIMSMNNVNSNGFTGSFFLIAAIHSSFFCVFHLLKKIPISKNAEPCILKLYTVILCEGS